MGSAKAPRAAGKWDATAESEKVFRQIPRPVLHAIARMAPGDAPLEEFQALLLAQRFGEGNAPTVTETAQMILDGHGKLLKSLPSEQRTPELCESAVLSDPWALQYVPDHVCLAPRVCEGAFHKLFFDLRALPARERTYQRCMLAFESGRVLDELPPAERTGVPLDAWSAFAKQMNRDFIIDERGGLKSSELLAAFALTTVPKKDVSSWLCNPHEASVRTCAIALARMKGLGWSPKKFNISEVPIESRPRVLAAVAALEAGYTESNWWQHESAMRDLIRPPPA